MDGRLELESPPGGGTTIRVSLPVSQDAAAAAA
jgi:signal transduction histidine kinase